jgi:hypothetical protein
MAANKVIRIGPIALTATLTTNILNPPAVSGGVGHTGNTATYIILRHVRIYNKGAAAVTFSLWLGATGGNVAGTEVIGSAMSIAAKGYHDWYGYLRLDAADFLVGGASAATSLTFQAEGEIGIAG